VPIRDTEVFNEFLASLTLRRPDQEADFGRWEVIPERLLVDATEHKISKPHFLWYGKSCTLSPDSMIKSVCNELQRRGHASTVEMARMILAILCLTSRSPESPVKRLNAIVEMIERADSSQFWISPYPPPPDWRTFRLGRFTVGPLDRKKLVYRCRKVGCDFFDLYPKRFSNRFVLVEGDYIPVQVLDWNSVRKRFKASAPELGGALVDYYFEHLTSWLQSLFYHEFQVVQEVPVAAGAAYLVRLTKPA
jgi:hypothetical protein